MDKLLNFDMAIEPLNGGYRARVITSTAGEGAMDFCISLHRQGPRNPCP